MKNDIIRSFRNAEEKLSWLEGLVGDTLKSGMSDERKLALIERALSAVAR